MRTYTGYRRHAPDGGSDGVAVAVHEDGSAPRPLDPRFELRRHSPEGCEWGCAGSGPAKLALALAADTFGDNGRALRVYHDLKFGVGRRARAGGRP